MSIDRIDNDKGVLSVELPVGYSEAAGEKHVVERPRQSRWPRVHLAYRGKRGVWTRQVNSRREVEKRMENRRGFSHTGSQKTPKGKRHAYTMHITETFESRCVIESDRKLTFE